MCQKRQHYNIPHLFWNLCIAIEIRPKLLKDAIKLHNNIQGVVLYSQG